MPRTLIPNRFGLPLVWILCWPISEVMAGPIITAASGSPGQEGGGSSEEARSGLTSRLLTAVDLEIHDGSLPVREWSSGASGMIPRGPSDLSSGTGAVGAAARSSARAAGRGASISAVVNSSPVAPSPMSTRASAPERSPERPTAAGDTASPAVPNLPMPPNVDRRTGSASTNPVSAQRSSASSPDSRASGTTIPATAGQSTVGSSVGGASNFNSGSSSSGSTTSSASSSSSIPQNPAVPTATTNLSTAAPATSQLATNTSPSGQSAAATGTGSSPMANTGSLNQASAPSTTSAGLTSSQAPVTGAPTTGSATSIAQAPITSATLPGSGTTVPIAAGSTAPVAGQSGQGSVPSTSGAANLATLPGSNTSVPMTAGSTNPGNSTTGTVTLIPAPGSPDGSSSAITPVSQSGATTLVSLVPNPQTTQGAMSGSGLAGSTSNQLNAAVGGTSGTLSTNTAATVLLVAPTPLSATSTLPPVQVSPTLVLASTPDTTGGGSDSLVLPQNSPEPGVLAMFAMVSVAAAIKSTANHFRSRS